MPTARETSPCLGECPYFTKVINLLILGLIVELKYHPFETSLDGIKTTRFATTNSLSKHTL